MTQHSTSSGTDNCYEGRRATVMGLGTFGGGVAAVRFLAERGAVVSITDLRSEHDLSDSLEQLADVPINNLWLSENPEQAFTDCDLLVVNPAVPPDNAAVKGSLDRGIQVTSEIELFLEHDTAPIVAVTGSNGKSTTASLIHHLARPWFQSQQRKVWLGGNIGTSLLNDVERIDSKDVVILELSSFQLYQLRHRNFAPNIAVLTNFSPNHLEWHGSLDAYLQAKNIVFRRQSRDDLAVLPVDLCHSSDWRVRGQKLAFGVGDGGEDGIFVEENLLIFRSNGGEDAVRFNQPSQLPGRHNLANIAAAACVVWKLGVAPEDFLPHLPRYQPLPHRLQLVANGRDVRFYEDSIATTPESAIAALDVCQPGCVILAGGYDKGIDLADFARHIAQKASAAILMGQTSQKLSAQIGQCATSQNTPETRIADDFPNAFSQAVELVKPGGIVLLSPGCASYGWFTDFRDRGDQFTTLAEQWVNNS